MRVLLVTSNAPLSVLIKRSFSRFRYSWDQVDNGFDAFQKIITQSYDLVISECALERMDCTEILKRLGSLDNFKHPNVIVLTQTENERNSIEMGHFPKTQIISRPIAIRNLVSTVQQTLHQGTRVACIGGGTGLFTLLSGLKTLSGLELYSVVSMSDDGGSTGRLRDAFGILPPGDVRRSLVALSTAPDLLNELIQYRFERGEELKGHNLGNLLLTALAEMRGSMSSAVKSIGEILNIQGHVIPVTESTNKLMAEFDDGTLAKGESEIDRCADRNIEARVQRIWLEPKVTATADALQALYNAHYIILGPGDLFTSLVSNLLVDGISEAIRSSSAKIIYICNVMTKPGETAGFQVEDHVQEMIHYLGRDVLDFIIYAKSRALDPRILEVYKLKNQEPVTLGLKSTLEDLSQASLVEADIVSEHELVRHDSLKLAAVIKKIIDESR